MQDLCTELVDDEVGKAGCDQTGKNMETKLEIYSGKV
jgi:hypothetical protein